MKSIILHYDEAFFNKMKEDKFKRERELGYKLTWETYIRLLFGFVKQYIILQ